MSFELSDRFYGFNKRTRRIAASYHRLLKDPSIREDIANSKASHISIDLSEVSDPSEVADLKIFSSHKDLNIQPGRGTDGRDSRTLVDVREYKTSSFNFFKSSHSCQLLQNGNSSSSGDIELSVNSLLIIWSILMILVAISDIGLKISRLMSSNVMTVMFLAEKFLLHGLCLLTIARYPQRIVILVPYFLCELGITLGYSEQISCSSTNLSNGHCSWFSFLFFESGVYLSFLYFIGTNFLLLVLLKDSIVAMIKATNSESTLEPPPPPPPPPSMSEHTF